MSTGVFLEKHDRSYCTFERRARTPQAKNRPAPRRRPLGQHLHNLVSSWFDLGVDLGGLELDGEEILADLQTGRD